MVRWERASKHGVWGITESPSLSLSLSSLSPTPLPRPSSINNTRRGEEGRERASERECYVYVAVYPRDPPLLLH